MVAAFSVPFSPVTLTTQYTLSASVAFVPSDVSTSVQLNGVMYALFGGRLLGMRTNTKLDVAFLPCQLTVMTTCSAMSVKASDYVDVVSTSLVFSSTLLVSSIRDRQLTPNTAVVLFSPGRSARVETAPSKLF